jgi:hypothetical protein
MEKMKNQNTPFKVPDNYFEQLTEKVMENMEAQELKSTKRGVSSWFLYASAAAVLIFVISFVGFKMQQEKLVVDNLDSIAQIKDSNFTDEVVYLVENHSDKLLTQDVVDNDLIDWSDAMDLDDEEFYLVINYF